MGLSEGSLRSQLRRAFGIILVGSKYSEGWGANCLSAFVIPILLGRRQGWDAFHPHNTDRKTEVTSKGKDLRPWRKRVRITRPQTQPPPGPMQMEAAGQVIPAADQEQGGQGRRKSPARTGPPCF